MPGCLRIRGLSFDTISDVVATADLATPEGIRLLWGRVADWECSDYYSSVCSSLQRAVSGAVVSHSYDCEEDPPDFYAKVRWDQDRVLEAIEGDWDVYEVNNFRECMSKTMRGRSVIYTRDGFVGVASCQVRRGDVLVLVVDSPRPFVFRQLNHRSLARMRSAASFTPTSPFVCYEVVSDAYLHGFDISGTGLGAPHQMFLF